MVSDVHYLKYACALAYRNVVASAYNGTASHQADGEKFRQDVNQYRVQNHHSKHIISPHLKLSLTANDASAINIDRALVVLLLDGESQVVEVSVQKAIDLISSKLFKSRITKQIAYFVYALCV